MLKSYHPSNPQPISEFDPMHPSLTNFPAIEIPMFTSRPKATSPTLGDIIEELMTLPLRTPTAYFMYAPSLTVSDTNNTPRTNTNTNTPNTQGTPEQNPYLLTPSLLPTLPLSPEPLANSRRQYPLLNDICCYLLAHSSSSGNSLTTAYPLFVNERRRQPSPALNSHRMFELTQKVIYVDLPHGTNRTRRKLAMCLYLVSRFAAPPRVGSLAWKESQNLMNWLRRASVPNESDGRYKKST